VAVLHTVQAAGVAHTGPEEEAAHKVQAVEVVHTEQVVHRKQEGAAVHREGAERTDSTVAEKVPTYPHWDLQEAPAQEAEAAVAEVVVDLRHPGEGHSTGQLLVGVEEVPPALQRGLVALQSAWAVLPWVVRVFASEEALQKDCHHKQDAVVEEPWEGLRIHYLHMDSVAALAGHRKRVADFVEEVIHTDSERPTSVGAVQKE
jgi:hypothetical protein